MCTYKIYLLKNYFTSLFFSVPILSLPRIQYEHPIVLAQEHKSSRTFTTLKREGKPHISRPKHMCRSFYYRVLLVFAARQATDQTISKLFSCMMKKNHPAICCVRWEISHVRSGRFCWTVKALGFNYNLLHFARLSNFHRLAQSVGTA